MSVPTTSGSSRTAYHSSSPISVIPGRDVRTSDAAPFAPFRAASLSSPPALALLILAAFALRAAGLHEQSLWLDEVDAIAMARTPVQDQLRRLLQIGENGPLYFLLLRPWLALAGTSEYGLRFLSVACSTLAVAVCAALVRALLRLDATCARAGPQGPAQSAPPGWPRSLPFATALLVCLSPYVVWYAQDGKMYALYLLLALLAQYSFVRGWRRSGWLPWLGSVAAGSLLLYVHLFGALVLAANSVAGLMLWRRYPQGRAGYALATAALTLPYAPLALWQKDVLLRGADVGYRPVDAASAALALAEQFTLHLAWRPPATAWLPFAALAVAGGWALRSAPVTRILLLAWLVIPFAGTMALQGRVPVFRDRYLTPMIVPMFVLMAAGLLWLLATRLEGYAGRTRWIERTTGRLPGLLLAGYVAGAWAYALAHRPPNADFRAAAALVRSLAGPDDQIGFLAGYAERPFAWYFGGPYRRVELPYTNYPGMTEQEGLRAVAGAIQWSPYLWVVRWEDWMWDSRDLTGEGLRARARPVLERRFAGGVTVTRYELAR